MLTFFKNLYLNHQISHQIQSIKYTKSLLKHQEEVLDQLFLDKKALHDRVIPKPIWAGRLSCSK